MKKLSFCISIALFYSSNTLADWTLLNKYELQNVSVDFFVDFTKINNKGNVFVPALLNYSKANDAGVLSEKLLLEIDCNGKKLAKVESGLYTGPMGSGKPPTHPMDSVLGPMKYERVPFVDWQKIDNTKAIPFYVDIYKKICIP